MPYPMTRIAKQWPEYRGHGGKSRRLLATVLAFSLWAAAPVFAVQEQPGFTLAALQTPRMTTHAKETVPVRVVQSVSAVAAGSETLRLAARLEEGGGLIERPVRWRILRLEETRRVPVQEAAVPVLRKRLPPGDYLVEARYGLRTARTVLTLASGEQRDVVFVLNVGGLRAVTTVGRANVAVAPVEHRILRRLPGGGLVLVARSRVPGEILRLPAGRYVVESVFLNGNVKARNEVLVKPGRLHSLAVRALAGVVDIAAEGTEWTLRALDDDWQLQGRGRARLVLAPGNYVWRAGAHQQALLVRAESRLRLGGARR